MEGLAGQERRQQPGSLAVSQSMRQVAVAGLAGVRRGMFARVVGLEESQD